MANAKMAMNVAAESIKRAKQKISKTVRREQTTPRFPLAEYAEASLNLDENDLDIEMMPQHLKRKVKIN